MSVVHHKDGNLKVFVIINNIIYRKILSKAFYKIDDNGTIILPPFHYCKGCIPINNYIENMINNITWEECRLYSTIRY